jgi:murein DD-endopeptidase MepM/ murein hydrolase activator NlpD
MRNHPEEKPQPDHFTRELRRLNGYTEEELREWLLMPGMKFGDTEKWWQPGATRDKPHEGVDLLIFLDGSGKRHLLPPGTAIPPLLRGTEVARIPDFMGETVILAHDTLVDGGRRLHTFYGHLQPSNAPASGKIMAADSPLGKIGTALKTTTTCPPHLHLSLAWIDESYPIQNFRWGGFCASATFKPGDPLAFMSRAGI